MESNKRRRLVTAQELANEIGVDRKTVYRAYWSGEIRSYGLGRSLRFDADEVLKK